MIKLPEPVNQSLAEDIAALDCRYRGSPSYEHDAAYMRKAAEDLVLKGYAIYTEAQLKQAVRDVLELAFQVAGPEDSYQDERFKAKADSAMRVRALIEEIDA